MEVDIEDTVDKFPSVSEFNDHILIRIPLNLSLSVPVIRPARVQCIEVRVRRIQEAAVRPTEHDRPPLRPPRRRMNRPKYIIQAHGKAKPRPPLLLNDIQRLPLFVRP